VREQHLGGAQAVAAEAALVALHEPHLPHGGRGLQLVHGLRAARPAEPLHALRDRAARHEDDAAAGAHQRRDLRRPAADGGDVQAAAVVGDQRRAHLDDQRLRVLDGAHAASSRAIALVTASQPSPESAETTNQGRFQRRAATMRRARASGSSTASRLLKISQRALRESAGS
jgi:hypothetical protein